MIEEELLKEKNHLKKIIKEIDKQNQEKQGELSLILKERSEFSLHFSDDYYTMDDEEIAQESQRFDEYEIAINVMEKQIERLNRQRFSPFFGRIDFKSDDEKSYKSYYIGVNNLVKVGDELPLVCDWRAPVSSLFYDYELGRAEYVAPSGTVSGNIGVKRQYEIKDAELVNAFDSSLVIGDEILRGVLSKNTSKKMQTIINTIQKEQNKIIRDNSSKNILVQGVAGSGKTSIALHRIAYLLYQNKDTLKAEDILILSPNPLLSDYISDVLPELGEENMAQMSFYRLAKDELKHLKLKIETREKNVDGLTDNTKRLNEVAYKHTYDFYESLQKFCEKYFDLIFKPNNIKLGSVVVSANELTKLYSETYKSKSPAVRVEWIIDYIIDKFDITKNVQEVSERIKRMIYPFFVERDIIKIYADFLTNIGMTFSLNKNGEIRYDDIGALLYITNYFIGIKKYTNVKYLIIDEMQDYSFVLYSVFNQIFDCKKIVLGDINQCIDKIMSDEDLKRLQQMLSADLVVLNKAYRSTVEITNYANKVKGIDCDCVLRHGEEPVVVDCGEGIYQKITDIIKENPKTKIAILTRNEEEAKNVYINILCDDEVGLCTSTNDEIKDVTVMPSYIAKGLEFDAVIVPFANEYKSAIDKNLMYVSCTRALHKLYLLNS